MPFNSLSRFESLLGFFAWLTPSSSLAGVPSGGAVSVKEALGVQVGQLRNIDGAGFACGYADVMANRPQVLPEVDIPFHEP